MGCVGRCTCVHVRARSVATGGCGLASAIAAVRFNLLGAPKRIHSDNAAEYSSEHCSRYTKRANHTHTTPTYTRAGHVIQDRALCPPSRRRVHAQTYFSSTACHQSSFCTWSVPVLTCTCIFCTSSRQQNRRHVNPSFTIHCWHLPCCTSKFLSARGRAHSLRVAAECPPP